MPIPGSCSGTTLRRVYAVDLHAPMAYGEQERREPHGAARALLLVASKQPAAVRAAFQAAAPVSRKGTDKVRGKRGGAQTRSKAA